LQWGLSIPVIFLAYTSAYTNFLVFCETSSSCGFKGNFRIPASPPILVSNVYR
jgi:hypothetical protein